MTDTRDDPTTGTAGSSQAEAPTKLISEAIVRVYKAEFGKGPKSIKVTVNTDTVVAVLRGGFSIVEEALRKAGHADQVRDQR